MKARSYSKHVGIIVFVAFAGVLNPPSASATIQYKISLDHTERHTIRVEIDIPAASPGTKVAMPAWNALYQVRDFAYRIYALRAESGDSLKQPVLIHALDQQTWQLDPAIASDTNSPAQMPPSVRLEYETLWNDPGPFNSQVDMHHAFLNLAELLMYLPDRRDEDVEVSFESIPPEWRLAAELSPGRDKHSFVASSYDALVDAPVEAGTFSDFTFSDGPAHFRVVVDAADWNKSHLEEYLRRITSYEIQLMGGPPFAEYTFFFHLGPGGEVGAGGMEHSFSTAISATSVETAAPIAAHEFFHAWNVKRIRPEALEPVDYSKEQPTRALWFAEGVTSAYAAYALERTGLWPKQQFYANLAGQISELESRPARGWQSVEEASLDAWLEKYDDYSASDRSISYYNKGQILGVLLDLQIRSITSNHRSLDDVLRRMNSEYAQKGKFYKESDGIRAAVEGVSRASFESFFRRYVSGTDELPFDDFLAYAGWELKVETVKTPELGFSPTVTNQQVIASSVASGSAAASSGLRNGDVLVQVNGKPVAQNAAMIRDLQPGDPVNLVILRGRAESQVSFDVGVHEDRQYSIVEMPHPSDRQKHIREGILRGSTD